MEARKATYTGAAIVLVSGGRVGVVVEKEREVRTVGEGDGDEICNPCGSV